tara:strand:+ start:2189 stop:4033 length:1845 start_codon:yes stop_codon:yes gene_type:complete
MSKRSADDFEFVPDIDFDPRFSFDKRRLNNPSRERISNMDGPFSPAMYAAMKRGDAVTKDTTFVPYGEYMARRSARAAVRAMPGGKAKSAPKKRTYQKKVYQIPSLSVKDYGQARLKRGSKFTRTNYGESLGKATKRQKSNRTKYGYTGRGMYGAKFLSRIGRAVTSPTFIKGLKRGVGYGADALSAMAYIDPELLPFAAGAQAASGYMGRGMYNPVKHGVNDLISGGGSSVPMIMSVPDETGSLIVSHTERVADIIAPADDKFHVQSHLIQAGLESTFPWLHQLASCYEEYEVLQCVFKYQGHDIVGTTSSLDLQGQVIAATKYNVKSKSFTDRHQMQAYPHATSCSMNGSLQSGVEAHPGKIASGDTHRYIRTGGLAQGTDISDYDHARFELALNNTPSDLFNKEVGQLFVYYTIKLSKPRLHAGRGKAISSYKQYCLKTTANLVPFPWGEVGSIVKQPLVASLNSLDMTYTAETGGDSTATWTFPANANGKYRCTMAVQGVNLDDASYDLGVPHVLGEVVLCDSFLDPIASRTRLAVEDGLAISMLIFEVVVRPQVGNTANSVSINPVLAGDTVVKSFVIIEEVNDFDASTAQPEIVGTVDGTIKTITDLL